MSVEDCIRDLDTLRLASSSHWFSSCLTFRNWNVITCYMLACWKPSAKGTVLWYCSGSPQNKTGWNCQVPVLNGLLLSMSHLHTCTRRTAVSTHPQRLLLSDIGYEQSPQLALRGFRMETRSSKAKNNIRQVCCPAVVGLRSCCAVESRVCVLTSLAANPIPCHV